MFDEACVEDGVRDQELLAAAFAWLEERHGVLGLPAFGRNAPDAAGKLRWLKRAGALADYRGVVYWTRADWRESIPDDPLPIYVEPIELRSEVRRTLERFGFECLRDGEPGDPVVLVLDARYAPSLPTPAAVLDWERRARRRAKVAGGAAVISGQKG
jgi:hypothetical protein